MLIRLIGVIVSLCTWIAKHHVVFSNIYNCHLKKQDLQQIECRRKCENPAVLHFAKIQSNATRYMGGFVCV